MKFFDAAWNTIGTKIGLVDRLESITGIDRRILLNIQPLDSIAVAQKFSWAANRTTTRIEDVAYCLLGIFDVNMPLLYGEEEKAFIRLQFEIIKSNADLSILAWKAPAKVPGRGETVAGRVARWSKSKEDERVYCGVLADTPMSFASCGSFKSGLAIGPREFAVTNYGIKTKIQVLSDPPTTKCGPRYILPLECYDECGQSLGIRLRKCGPDTFFREDPHNLVAYPDDLFTNAAKNRYLLMKLPRLTEDTETPFLDEHSLRETTYLAQMRPHALQVILADATTIYDAWPWSRYDDEDCLFFTPWSRLPTKMDVCMMRLMTKITYVNKGKDIDVEFETMFIAAGWASERRDHLQCTLLDYQSMASDLKDLESQIVSWEHDRSQVLQELERRKIPRRSAVTFSVPGTESDVCMSFSLNRKDERAICRNWFWTLSFSYDVDVPLSEFRVNEGSWKLL